MNPNSRSSDISAKEIKERLNNKEHLNLLDVREKIEFHTYNIGGINVPVNKLTGSFDKISWQQDDEIIVICSAGLRSQTAKSILEQNGYQNVRNLHGGLLALEKLKSI